MLARIILLGLGLTLVALHASTILTSTTHWTMKKWVSLERMTRILKKTLKRPDGLKMLNSVQTGWIQQKLDHFNPLDTRCYYQRYYVSTIYWNPSNGPVFVYVGGEVELFPAYLVGGLFLTDIKDVTRGPLLPRFIDLVNESLSLSLNIRSYRN